MLVVRMFVLFVLLGYSSNVLAKTITFVELDEELKLAESPKEQAELIQYYFNDQSYFNAPNELGDFILKHIKDPKSEKYTPLYIELIGFYSAKQWFAELIYYGEFLKSNNLLTSASDTINVNYHLIETYKKLQLGHKMLECLDMIEQLNFDEKHYLYNDILSKSIINIYYTLGRYSKVIALVKQRIKKLYDSPDLAYAPSFAAEYNDLGVYYMAAKMPDSAAHYYNVALKIMDTVTTLSAVDKSFRVGLYKGNLGSVYIGKGNFEAAIPLLQHDIEASIDYGDLINAARSMVYIADAYAKLNDTKNARYYLKQAKPLVFKFGMPSLTKSYLKISSNLNQAVGNYNMAYAEILELHTLTDSLTKIKEQNTIIGLEMLYDVDKKEALLEKKEVEKNEALAKVKEQRLMVRGLIIIMILVVIILVLLFLRIQERKRRALKLEEQNKKILSQNEFIENALTEKEILLKEIHHRIKNNLQFISNVIAFQGSKSNNEQVKSATKESQSRIEAMSLIHKSLYQSADFSSIKLNEYLTELIEHISKLYSTKGISLQINTNNCALEMEKAIPLGLIISELVANSYKYAFNNRQKGQIKIEVLQTALGYSLIVEDDGVGLPSDINLETIDTLGLELVVGLVRQIDGTVNVDTANGTKFIIDFK